MVSLQVIHSTASTNYPSDQLKLRTSLLEETSVVLWSICVVYVTVVSHPWWIPVLHWTMLCLIPRVFCCCSEFGFVSPHRIYCTYLESNIKHQLCIQILLHLQEEYFNFYVFPYLGRKPYISMLAGERCLYLHYTSHAIPLQ